MTFEFLGQDFSRYVSGTIAESVEKASQIANVIEKTVEIKLLDSNGRFSKMLDGIRYEGETVNVYDDYGTIFEGRVLTGRKDGGLFVITCQSFLAPFLGAYVSTEQTYKTPAKIIETVLQSFGLSDYIDSGSFAIADKWSGAVYCNAYASASMGTTLADFINQVAELGSLSVYYQRGKIYCSYPEYPDNSLRTITDRSFIDIAKLKYNDQYYTAYSVDYVGSGSTPLPAISGDQTSGKVWTQTTGTGNPIQCANESTAIALGNLKLAANSRIKKRITGTVDTSKVPVQTNDVYEFNLASLSITGLYRVISYSRNQNIATVTFEEVLN